jgi:hypothetical protein
MSDTTQIEDASHFDRLTIAAIGMIAYLLANVVHEGLGHGGACLLVGGRPLALSSAWFDGDLAGVSPWGVRVVKAGGTVANLVVGLGLLGLLRSRRAWSGHWYYFVWLATVVNLFQGGGYLLVSPLANFGDWKGFILGLEPSIAWKLGLTAIGLAIYAATLFVAVRRLEPLLGRDAGRRKARARWLCWLPYGFAGAFVFSVAAALNPAGKIFMLTSAAAHLGGTAWLVWTPAWINAARPGTPDPALSLARHYGWLAAGGVALILCVFVLGPAIELGSSP